MDKMMYDINRYNFDEKTREDVERLKMYVTDLDDELC